MKFRDIIAACLIILSGRAQAAIIANGRITCLCRYTGYEIIKRTLSAADVPFSEWREA
jgi:hypothetical protein